MALTGALAPDDLKVTPDDPKAARAKAVKARLAKAQNGRQRAAVMIETPAPAAKAQAAKTKLKSKPVAQ